MPNMFGGDQDHPAYDPSRKLNPKREFMLNDVLYTRSGTHDVEVQYLNGSTAFYSMSHPAIPIAVFNHFKQQDSKRGRNKNKEGG